MQRGGKNSSSRRCLARRETLSFESGTRRREGRKGKKRRIESGLFKACFAGFQWRPFFERVPDYIRTFERGFGWWSLPLLKSYLFRRKRKGRPARWRGGEEGVEIGVRTAAWRLTNWTRGWILGYRAVKKKKKKKKERASRMKLSRIWKPRIVSLWFIHSVYDDLFWHSCAKRRSERSDLELS